MVCICTMRTLHSCETLYMASTHTQQCMQKHVHVHAIVCNRMFTYMYATHYVLLEVQKLPCVVSTSSWASEFAVTTAGESCHADDSRECLVTRCLSLPAMDALVPGLEADVWAESGFGRRDTCAFHGFLTTIPSTENCRGKMLDTLSHLSVATIGAILDK